MATNYPTINLDVHEETWLPVPGYEGIYSVSSIGRVRRDAKGSRTFPGKILKYEITKDGYYRVQFYLNKIGKRFSVHRLVALAFIGECPRELVVNHKDGNKKNNRPENLEYVTDRENKNHAKTSRTLSRPSYSF